MRQQLDPTPPGARAIIHKSRLIRGSYLALARTVAGTGRQSGKRDLGIVVVNSNWTRETLLRRHGIDSRVVYPPVRVIAPTGAVERKRHSFITIGRISAEKRIERMIGILREVRAHGHDVELHIVGDTRETEYGQRVEQLSRREGDWIVLHGRQFVENVVGIGMGVGGPNTAAAPAAEYLAGPSRLPRSAVLLAISSRLSVSLVLTGNTLHLGLLRSSRVARLC